MPIQVNLKTKIRFNGQEYDGVESMPPDVRQNFEKIMASAGKSGSKVTLQSTGKIVFNGQEYASPEAMPEPVRQQYQQIMGMVDKNGNGIPDMLEGNPAGNDSSFGLSGAFPESAPLIQQNDQPARRAQKTSRLLVTVLVALGVIILLIILILAIRH